MALVSDTASFIPCRTVWGQPAQASRRNSELNYCSTKITMPSGVRDTTPAPINSSAEGGSG
ncbi:MAG TPA: hypothetical protein DCG12_05125 [Planctomycetaceae bacterium]|nr:hypothetical protein [Planctomycetaceae bacterium]